MHALVQLASSAGGTCLVVELDLGFGVGRRSRLLVLEHKIVVARGGRKVERALEAASAALRRRERGPLINHEHVVDPQAHTLGGVGGSVGNLGLEGVALRQRRAEEARVADAKGVHIVDAHCAWHFGGRCSSLVDDGCELGSIRGVPRLLRQPCAPVAGVVA